MYYLCCELAELSLSYQLWRINVFTVAINLP